MTTLSKNTDNASLRADISAANSREELRQILDSIPKQENGHGTQLYRMLEDALWYTDLTTLDQQKEFMLNKLDKLFLPTTSLTNDNQS